MPHEPTASLACPRCGQRMRIRVQGPRTLKGKILCPSCKLRFLVRDADSLDAALLEQLDLRPTAPTTPTARSTHAGRDAIDTFRDRVRQAATNRPLAPRRADAERDSGYAPRPRPLLEGIQPPGPRARRETDHTIPEEGPPASMRVERAQTTAMPAAQRLRGRRGDVVSAPRARHDAASVLKGLTRSERAPTRPPTRDVPLDPFPQSHGQTRDLGRYLADSAVFELASVDGNPDGTARRLQDMPDEEPDFISGIQPIPSSPHAARRDVERTEVARALSADLAATRPDPTELATTETELESDLLAALDPDALMRGDAGDLFDDAHDEDDEDDEDDEYAATRQFSSVEAMLEHGARLAAREARTHASQDAPTRPANPLVDDAFDDLDDLEPGAETRTYGREALDKIRDSMHPSSDAPTPPAVVKTASPDDALVAASRPTGPTAAVTVGETPPPPSESDIVDISIVGPAPTRPSRRPTATSDWTLGDPMPDDQLPVSARRSPRPLERSRSRVLPWLVFVLVLIIVGGLVWWLIVGSARSAPPVQSSPAAEPPDRPGTPTPAAIDAARREVSHAAAIAAAMATARGHVAAALAPEAAVTRQFELATRARTDGDLAAALGALEVLEQLPGGVLGDAEHALLYADVLIESGEHARAREVLWAARETFVRDGRIVERLTRAIDEDRHLLPRVDTLGTDDLDGIKALGGGSTLTFKFKRNGKTTAAFKPEQTRRQSDYRAEIASWRLCKLLRCAFEIPYNRPVKLSRTTFEALYARYSSAKQLEYRIGFTDLIWHEEGGVDYLYGTEKAWVPSFTQFPIEVTSVWEPWLSQSEPLDELAVSLDDALRPWQSSEFTQKHYTRVRELAGDLTTRQLAHQISDMLVFDYLVTNWDRFSGVKQWWGTNCQFGDGRIISIDNGAAFAVGRNSKVKRRFMRAERFSRSLILELRLLDRETTLERLFPDPTRHERERFDLFWQKRAEVLGRIDALVEKHGEDAVLVFE